MLAVALPSRKLLALFLRREFDIAPETEPLMHDASCALRDGLLSRQGRVFVFERRICFYSNIFGAVKRVSILFSDVQGIRKRPAAIEITCADHSIVLASFWDRSNTMRVLTSMWNAWRRIAHAEEQGSTAAVTAGATDESPRSSSSSGGECSPVTAPASIQFVSARMPAMNAAMPPLEDGYTELDVGCDCCSFTIADFYTLVFSDGSRFLEAFRAARGESDVVVMPWADTANGFAVRTVTWTSPLAGASVRGLRMPGIPPSTRIQEEQRCITFADEASSSLRLVLLFHSNQLDIPLGDLFTIESRLELHAPREDAQASVFCYARVRWLRQPSFAFLRRQVETRSIQETASSFRQLLRMAQSYLHNAIDVVSNSGGGEGHSIEGLASAPDAESPTPPEASGITGEADHPSDGWDAIKYGPVAFGAVCDALRISDLEHAERECQRRRDSQSMLFKLAVLAALVAVFICGWSTGSRASRWRPTETQFRW